MADRVVTKAENFLCVYAFYYYPHMPIGTVWIYRLLFVCFFVILCVCTVTDFSGEDTASGVKFCTVVQARPGQGSSHFWGTLLPRSPKLDESASGGKCCRQTPVPPLMARSLSVEGTGVYWQYLPSAYVDIRPSPKTGVLVDLTDVGFCQFYERRLSLYWNTRTSSDTE